MGFFHNQDKTAIIILKIKKDRKHTVLLFYFYTNVYMGGVAL